MDVGPGGKEMFLVFEFVRVDQVANCRITNMVVIDGLVYFDCLAKVEHFTLCRDLRFINNNHPILFGLINIFNTIYLPSHL